jgi:hypothetical protein
MSNSVADELTKLVQLRDSGVLTDTEFETQKSRLLASPTSVPAGATSAATTSSSARVTTTNASKRAKPKTPRWQIGFLAVLVMFVGGGLLIGLISAITSNSPGTSATITHRVVRVVALNEQSVRVWVTWTDTGTASGSASCVMNVTAYDAYGDETGSGVDSTGPNGNLKPGQTQTLYQDIVITDNDAADVTSLKDVQIVDC